MIWFRTWNFLMALPDWAFNSIELINKRYLQCAFASLEYEPSMCPDCGKISSNATVECNLQSTPSGDYYCAMSNCEMKGKEYYFPDDPEDMGNDMLIYKASEISWEHFCKPEGFSWMLMAARDDRQRKKNEKQGSELYG